MSFLFLLTTFAQNALGTENMQWKLVTAKEQESRSKHGNESLLEKYKK